MSILFPFVSFQYTCKNSGLMEIHSGSGMTYAWWTDRNGQKRVNWAGAPTDSEKCECGGEDVKYYYCHYLRTKPN